MLQHAFLIQAHTFPLLLARIISKLNAPNHHFFINIDAKVDPEPFEKALTPPLRGNIHFIGHRLVFWGGYSLIECTLNLLSEAFQSNIKYDYFHFISGQDYPCVSNDAFDYTFEKSDGRSYMKYDNEEEHEIWNRYKGKYEKRYRYYYFRDSAKLSPARIVLNCILTKIPIPYRKSIKGVRAGWEWFSWHRNVVTFVVNYFIENPNFLKRFKHTSCCDELIFHTLLYPYLDELNICKEDSKRFLEWHPKRQYTGRLPLILNESEYREIIESGAVFCRKVEPDISNILMDLLDKR